MIFEKKLLTIIFINLLLCTQALAGWDFVLQDDKGTKVYIDAKTFRKDSNYYYIWILNDLKVPFKGTNADKKRPISIPEKIKSAEMQVQIDCNLMKAETLEYIFYDGQMGEGRPTFLTHDKIEWKYYPPGSSMHIVIKAICSL